MSLQAFQSKVFKFILVWSLTAATALGSPNLPKDASSSEGDVSTDRTFRRIIKREKKVRGRDRVFEDTVSGVAAIVIGIYGYYFDNRGLLAKVVYSATQTAGVYLISDATFRANQPSLVLDIDSQWKTGGEFRYEEFRRMVVRNDDDLKIADYKKNAYAGALLATIYLYNASKEKEIKALSNVFYFLGFNFILISSASFYKAFTYERTQTGGDSERSPPPQVHASLLPFPRIALTF